MKYLGYTLGALVFLVAAALGWQYLTKKEEEAPPAVPSDPYAEAVKIFNAHKDSYTSAEETKAGNVPSWAGSGQKFKVDSKAVFEQQIINYLEQIQRSPQWQEEVNRKRQAGGPIIMRGVSVDKAQFIEARDFAAAKFYYQP